MVSHSHSSNKGLCKAEPRWAYFWECLCGRRVTLDQLVTEHLSLRAGQIQEEGFNVSGVWTKLEPILLAHLTHQELWKMN
jgi:hypothetical protein